MVTYPQYVQDNLELITRNVIIKARDLLSNSFGLSLTTIEAFHLKDITQLVIEEQLKSAKRIDITDRVVLHFLNRCYEVPIDYRLAIDILNGDVYDPAFVEYLVREQFRKRCA